MRISDWSSDVCSSDLCPRRLKILPLRGEAFAAGGDAIVARHRHALMPMGPGDKRRDDSCAYGAVEKPPPAMCESGGDEHRNDGGVCLRSEEHTSELQSLMRISYAVFCLKKKKNKHQQRSAPHYNSLRLHIHKLQLTS